jgi:hypothetical protein
MNQVTTIGVVQTQQTPYINFKYFQATDIVDTL